MKAYLKDSVTFPLVPMSKTVRSIDKEFMLARGNHKSVFKSKEIVRELINEDMIHGHALPLTLECIKYLNNILIAPIGVVKQETIDKHGNAVTKFWMTHDQSFPGPSGLSVNSWLIVEKLPPCMFGFFSKESYITLSV